VLELNTLNHNTTHMTIGWLYSPESSEIRTRLEDALHGRTVVRAESCGQRVLYEMVHILFLCHHSGSKDRAGLVANVLGCVA
jgi:hypothetical protein